MDITFAGDKITLVGKEVKVGDEAVNFTATKADLSDFNLDELKGKVVIISAAPSLDTSVCAFQAQRFNKEASDFSDDVAIVNITVDLPFAQKDSVMLMKLETQSQFQTTKIENLVKNTAS